MRISADRAEQLKQVAKVRGLPVAALVDLMVLGAIADGSIPDETPGIAISAEGGRVAITVDGLALAPMAPADALKIADELASRNRRSLSAIGPDFVEIGRTGRAVDMTITTPEGSTRRMFTPSVAADVARQIRTAAKNSSN
jgi:hypothetical protein